VVNESSSSSLPIIVAPPPNRQAPPQEQWLRAAYSGGWYEVIEKREGGSWRSLPRPYRIEGLLRHLADESKITGYRPEKNTRVIVFDIDQKKKYRSQYWDRYGESSELLELQRHVELIGGRVSLLRSSASGGLHPYVSLPSAIPCWLAHWVGRELLERSGMVAAAGQAELFPSQIEYSETERARSNGFRLPGQTGSALITGKTFIEDAELIYLQLLADIGDTEICNAWREILETARAKKKGWRIEKGNGAARVEKIKPTAKWTQHGQSQRVLAGITTAVRLANPHILCPFRLGAIIRKTAIATEGFEEYASHSTKKDLMRKTGGLAERWARSSLRKKFGTTEGVPEDKIGSDKDRNRRLFRQSQARLTRIWKSIKDASSWSKRQVARASGLSRRTLEKHWGYWVQLVAHTPLSNGVRCGSAPDPRPWSCGTAKKCCIDTDKFVFCARNKITCSFSSA
jgi:hypothetical protein